GITVERLLCSKSNINYFLILLYLKLTSYTIVELTIADIFVKISLISMIYERSGLCEGRVDFNGNALHYYLVVHWGKGVREVHKLF
ncbi:MAG: hypothetical protein ACD_58C00323G0001, partial [uncultured bacterium]